MWAVQSCFSKDLADEVLLAEFNGNIIGYISLRLNNSYEGEGVLNFIIPQFQRQGLYKFILIKGMEWCLSKKAEYIIISTQIINIPVQKVWVRLGFEPSHSYYTFHKWFD